jgi:hypothetical protein
VVVNRGDATARYYQFDDPSARYTSNKVDSRGR